MKIAQSISTKQSKKQQVKNEAIIHILEEWMADESGYDEKVWPIVKKDLEENRLSYRSRFSD